MSAKAHGRRNVDPFNCDSSCRIRQYCCAIKSNLNTMNPKKRMQCPIISEGIEPTEPWPRG